MRRMTAIGVAAMLGLVVLGCREDKPAVRTLAVSGTIEEIDLPNRTVQVSAFVEKLGREETFTVHVTDDTELLINGSLAKVEDVRVGERAEGDIRVIKENGSRKYVALRVQIERAEVVRAPGAASPAPPDAGTTAVGTNGAE